jgi:hypothetical protein
MSADTVPSLPPRPASPPGGRSPSAPAVGALTDLRRALRGGLTLPGEPAWDRARQAWNLAVEQRPVAVVDAVDVDDVQTVVRFAATHGLQVAMQATGHGAATLPPLADTVLVRTGAMAAVTIDPDLRRARVGAGAHVGDLVAAAGAHGLAFTAGSSPDVGVVGYTLGGGVGWLARSHGLACNQVVAAEVVTADGEARRVDADHDAALFWALRGGGGAFAAVTALEVALHPIAEVHAGALTWPLEHAADVLHAWRVWTHEVPDRVTSIGRILRYPPLPDLPPELRGQAFVRIEASFLDDEAEADRWLRPLRALRPATDTFATIPAPALGPLHGDPDHPVPSLGDHRLLTALPAAAIDVILDLVGPDRSSPLLAVDLRHLGGASGATAPGHGVLDRIDAAFALFTVGVPVGPDLAAAIGGSMEALGAAVAPWDAGRAYLNFAEQPADPARLFGGDGAARLREVKATYDPMDRFVSTHAVR